MKIDELRKRRKEILSITRRYGVEKVRVFGSLARGEGTEDSDVDLLVELGPDRGLLDIIAIKQDLEECLQREVDVVTEGGISPYIRSDILDQAINL